MGKKNRPHWSLTVIRRMVAQDEFFCAFGSAVAYFATPGEAREAVQEAVAALEETNFAETVKLSTHVADVYGVPRDEGGWYLKLTIIDEDGPEVLVISFHPLERPIKTNGGLVSP